MIYAKKDSSIRDTIVFCVHNWASNFQSKPQMFAVLYRKYALILFEYESDHRLLSLRQRHWWESFIACILFYYILKVVQFSFQPTINKVNGQNSDNV